MGKTGGLGEWVGRVGVEGEGGGGRLFKISVDARKVSTPVDFTRLS